MFYKPLAKKMRPYVREQQQAANAARAEFRETVGFSDTYLALMIIGGAFVTRVFDIRTRFDVFCVFGVYTLLFLGYLAIKSWEGRKNPPLTRYLDKLD